MSESKIKAVELAVIKMTEEEEEEEEWERDWDSKITEEEEEEEEWERDWDSKIKEKKLCSDLPRDILELIISRLYLIDCSRFHTISKLWRSISTPVRLTPPPYQTVLSPMAKSPWLISLRGVDNTSCGFYHPIYDGCYSMNIPELSGSTVCSSKDGWLLMCNPTEIFFFFNPFTKEMVEVPKWQIEHNYTPRITFSVPPTSPECVIFGIQSHDSKIVFIYSIGRGEREWNIRATDNEFPFYQSDSNPVFWKGAFYCLGKEGNIGVFDPKKDTYWWEVFAVSNGPQPPPNVSIENHYLVENNGDLLSIFFDKFGSWICLLKLKFDDQNEMVWEEIESLGDQMLYVDMFSCVSSKEVVKGMGNKIYFQRFGSHDDCVFYSLKTKRYHQCREDLYPTNEGRKNLYGTDQQLYCAWVEPKFETHADEMLKWVQNPMIDQE